MITNKRLKELASDGCADGPLEVQDLAAELLKLRRKGLPTSAKKGHPDTRKFTDFFMAAWKDRFGDDYHFQGAKDGKAAQTILKASGSLSKAQETVQRYMEDDDRFVVSNGHTLAILASKINAYRGSHGDDAVSGRNDPDPDEAWRVLSGQRETG